MTAAAADIHALSRNPILFQRTFWPHISLYREQRAILESVVENDETVVVAANGVGKDFTAALACLWFFLTRHPCRVVTSSVKFGQLKRVLWGEIRRFLQTARWPLSVRQGGPLVVNHMDVRKLVGGQVCGISYLIGEASSDEGLAGHHASSLAGLDPATPRTMWVCDEASGATDSHYQAAQGWARRMLIFGNPHACSNFFRNMVDEADGKKSLTAGW